MTAVSDSMVEAAGPFLYQNWPLVRPFVFEGVRAAIQAAYQQAQADARKERYAKFAAESNAVPEMYESLRGK